MADVYVQAVLIAVVVRTPDCLTQSVVGHDMPALIGQLLQDGPLGGRQRGSALRAVNGGVLRRSTVTLPIATVRGRHSSAR